MPWRGRRFGAVNPARSGRCLSLLFIHFEFHISSQFVQSHKISSRGAVFMSRICKVTGKKNKVVNSVARRGKARAVGGVGRKVTGVSKRVQKVNLQKKRVVVEGEVQTVRLSARALRSLGAGKIKGMALA